MEPEYKLIRFADPTKVKVNIKEKFAKLTLSSNKKPKDTTETANRNLEHSTARKRVSRNLMGDLMVDQNANPDCYVNPILRTDSSSRASSDENHDHTTDMEPLQVSSSQPTLTENQKDAEILSQRISNLTINAKTLAYSVNGEADAMENEVSISICSSSYDSDDAITISDSSTQIETNDMIISDIPKSGETADALLPCTFSNDKADRIIAFLRDVSQVRKELESGENESMKETFCDEIKNTQFSNAKNFVAADTESMAHDLENNSKHLMDETQPMNLTHFSLHSSNVDAVSMLKQFPYENREMRLANDETVANTTVSSVKGSSNSIFVLSQDVAQNLEPLLRGDVDESFKNSSSHSAPSQTSITVSETDSEAEEVDRIKNRTALSLQPETNTEAEDDKASPFGINKETALSSESENDSETEDVEVSPNQINKETGLSTESQIQQTTENSLSEFQQSFASINITAKINIKISITQSNDGESDSNASDDLHQTEVIAINSSTEDDDLPRALTEDDGSSNNQRPSNLASDTASTNTNEPLLRNDDDPGFVDHAQKILNQLYGKSWQTPDVIRTLSRTENNVRKSKPERKKDKVAPKDKDVLPEKVNVNQLPPEDSILDDFSIFRRNIKTNLDSTRTFDERKISKSTVKHTPKVNSEGRCKSTAKKDKQNMKTPQTEFKAKSTRKGTNYNQRWRQLIDDDNDEASYNASDDEKADKTGSGENFSSSNESDISWKESNNSLSSGSDSDRKRKCIKSKRQNSKYDNLVYLDLSKEEVEIVGGTPQTPLANNDEQFHKRLQEVLRTSKFEERPKLEATPKSHVKSKRKLFTPNFGNEDEQQNPQPEINLAVQNDTVFDQENVQIKLHPMPATFEPFNKRLEAVRTGIPLFKKPTHKSTSKSKTNATNENSQDHKTPPKQTATNLNPIRDASLTPNNKYGFLKSLDVCVARSLCHPDALYFRDNFRFKKEELAKKLYDLYNEKLFKNELQVPLIWNKKLLNTAGRCLNKKRMGTRTSVIELSEKVLTSADRLRCTLIHELCHAATWIFNGEGGHGSTWKHWAQKANIIFPEIPKIGVCHQYDIEYKYTYKCTLCAAKSHAHSKSKKVENIRCSYCHGAIEVYLNKKDKEGNIIATPVREPKGFAKFVKDKYKEYKRPDLKHADVMKILSNEFATMKVASSN